MRIKSPLSMVKYVEEILLGQYDIHSLVVEKPRILDVGANIGSFSIWASLRWSDYTSITSYEPHPNTFAILSGNVKRCNIRDITIHNAGLETFTGESVIYNNTYNCGSASMRPVDAWGSTPESCVDSVPVKTVSIETLDSFDIIKCDAEGIEGDFCKIYKHWKDVKAFLVEYHNPQLCYDIFDGMYRKGFTLCGGKVYNPVRGEFLFARPEFIDRNKAQNERQQTSC